MDDRDDLDAIFDDERDEAPEAVEPQQEPEQTEETQAQKAERERDDKGRFAPKGEEGESPAPVEEEAEPAFDHKAVLGERKRRQDAEARLQQLERQLQEMQQPKEQEPAPSLWEDEGKWQEHFGGQVVNTAVQQATMNAKLDMSEMMARQAHEDFDAMKEQFVQMMQENPVLQQQALADPHPWNKAYQIAKNHAKMQELGATDLSDLEAKIEARLREKLAAEQPQQAPQANLPRSLADSQSARGSGQQPSNDDFTLESILGN